MAVLLRALRALLAAFGPDLAKQYNAINIVSDILHVSRALHMLLPAWYGVLLRWAWPGFLLLGANRVPACPADLLQPE